MPKRYKSKSLSVKPTSSAPSSLTLSRVADAQNVPITKTVNELIQESRRDAGHERIRTTQSTSSVHPSLRAVLDMPVLPPPSTRLHTRGPMRMRRIPGPPPPRSWLTDSIHAPTKTRDIPWSETYARIRIQYKTSILPEGSFPIEQSLEHLTMKSMAFNWSWHAEYDHRYLAELPVKIKQNLLSYIAIYSDGKGPNPLHLLFPRDLEADELGEVRRLDLGNAIGSWSTLKKLEKDLGNEPTLSSQPASSTSLGSVIPETWEEDDSTLQPSIITLPLDVGLRFRNLKHLSLAVTPGISGSIASWAALLKIVPKLATISSLSLAYWPQPTYTPNASTGLVKIQNTISGSIPTATYGGTNFYTAFDNDWREAAGILRKLSRSLYCLQWLDLTGCGDWFSALTWAQNTNDNDVDSSTTGPDWNGTWRGVEHIVLAVGWSPGPAPIESNLQSAANSSYDDATPRSIDLNDHVEDHMADLSSQLQSARLGSRPQSDNNSPLQAWNVNDERAKYYHQKEVIRYKRILDGAKQVVHDLRGFRREHGGNWIDVDFGPENDF